MLDAVDQLEAGATVDPRYWMVRHAPDAVPAEFAPFHGPLTRLPEPGERHARIVFRGAAKSTLTLGMIMRACHQKAITGVVWVRAIGGDSDADREAIGRLAELAGLPCKVRHAQQLVIVNGVPIWTKTPTGAVRGLKLVTAAGAVIRPDTVVIDDIETRETARSKMQTDRLGRWMQADLFATAGHDAPPLRVVMLGTPITPSCLIARAMRREAPFDTWTSPMVVPYVDGDGRPAWPAVYDDGLEDRTDDDAWANEYLLQPLPEGALLLPPDRTRWVPDSEVEGVIEMVAVDPAAAGDDATGIVAAGSTPVGIVFTDAVQWNGHPEDGPHKVAELVRRRQAAGNTVASVHVEAVGAWRWYAKRVAELVAPIPVEYETPKVSKTERAVNLSRWQKRSAVWMAESLRGSPLDVELHTWTREGYTVTGHDDMADAAVWAAGAATLGWQHEPPTVTV